MSFYFDGEEISYAFPWTSSTRNKKVSPCLNGERWGLFSLAPQPHWYRTFAQRREHTHLPEFQAKRDRIVASDHLARVVWPEIIMQLPMRPLIFFAAWWDLMGDHGDKVFWSREKEKQWNKTTSFLGTSQLLFPGRWWILDLQSFFCKRILMEAAVVSFCFSKNP